MDQWWAHELWDFKCGSSTHIITKHSSPNEYILFFRGLILHTNLIINALIEVLMTFKSYEGFFRALGAIGQWSLWCTRGVNTKHDPLWDSYGYHQPPETPSCIGGEAIMHHSCSLQKG